jgi:MFS family permease
VALDTTPPGRRARRSAPTEARPKLLTRGFAVVTAASLAYFTAVGMLIPALPRYVDGPLGGGSVAVGVVVGAFSVTAVLVRPWAGILGDRRGRRPLLVIGAAVALTSILGYGLVPGVGGLTALRLVSGVGEALFFVGTITVVSDLAPPERRGEAMSLASLALYLGIAAGPLLAESLLVRAGFGAVWVAAAAACLVALVLASTLPETRPTHAGAAAAASGPRRLVHPAGLVPGMLLAASLVGMAGFLTFVPLHVDAMGVERVGPTLLLFAGIVVLVRSLGARLPDRWGHRRTIRAALVLSCVGLGVVGAVPTPAGLTAGTAVFALGVALLTPSVFALAVGAVAPHERSQVMATTSAFVDVAFGLGPVAMGLVAASHGLASVFLVGAATAVGGLVLLAVTAPSARRTPQPSPATSAR